MSKADLREIKLIDIKEVSSMTNISIVQLRRLVTRKEIPSFKIGRIVRFDQKEVIDWLNRKCRVA